MAISRNPIFGQLLVPSGQPPDCLTGKTNAIGVVHHGLGFTGVCNESSLISGYDYRPFCTDIARQLHQCFGCGVESYGLTGTELNTKTTARKSEPPVEERGSRFAVLEPVVEDINAMLNQMEPASTQAKDSLDQLVLYGVREDGNGVGMVHQSLASKPLCIPRVVTKGKVIQVPYVLQSNVHVVVRVLEDGSSSVLTEYNGRPLYMPIHSMYAKGQKHEVFSCFYPYPEMEKYYLEA
ncbi:hypothetical protein V6N12_037663 [Hibiscus sabdariffa]|uniref:Uncharacterized protein n=1 Tax=Hibiscus sabdariffa TaxID=183260 RepID=A0ABR2C357_9ROSI